MTPQFAQLLSKQNLEADTWQERFVCFPDEYERITGFRETNPNPSLAPQALYGMVQLARRTVDL